MTRNVGTPATIRLSVVSHGQGTLVHALLRDLAAMERSSDLEVILTLNLPETLPFSDMDFPFPISVVRNEHCKGFGANHNAAFLHQNTGSAFHYFCVVNPDIRLQHPVLESLRQVLHDSPGCALVAPVVVNREGSVEDSARALPTPFGILRKAMQFMLGRPAAVHKAPANPAWVAGMFLFFRAKDFAAVEGFDEGFHLYYEDVDICCRLRLAGRNICLDEAASVIHDARRSSHRELRYLRWHLGSMIRFFTSGVFFRCWLRLRKA